MLLGELANLNIDEHIVVVGHYSCGDVRDKHIEALKAIGLSNARVDRLCELNVIEQVANVCQTTIVRDAWERGQDLAAHGWVYGLKDGLLRDLNVTVVESRAATIKCREAATELFG